MRVFRVGELKSFRVYGGEFGCWLAVAGSNRETRIP